MIETVIRRALVVLLLAAGAAVLAFTIHGARLRDEVRATNWIRRQSMPGGFPTRFEFSVRGQFGPEFALRIDRRRHRCRGVPMGVHVEPSRSLVVVRGRVPDRRDLGDLQDTIGVVNALLDQGGVEVEDEESGRRWPAAEWRAAFVEREDLRRADHVVVEGTAGGLGTRGMRKFGRPDVRIAEFPHGREDAAMRLLERLVDFEIDGGVLDVSREIDLPGYPPGIRMVAHFTAEDEAQPPARNVWIEVVGFR